MNEIVVRAAPASTEGTASFQGRQYRCALGRGGIARDKREGDGCTPAGRFPVRRLLYRADRVEHPSCSLPVQPIGPSDGWCDEPGDPAYNRPVALPYPARHEVLCRDDHLYDYVLVIGHNDAPVVPGKGSAVFLHLAHSDYRPTDGCVAFAQPDFVSLLAGLNAQTVIVIEA